MAEQPVDGQTTAEQASNLVIHKLYVKDLSFENPGSPAVYNENWQPKIDVNVQNSGRQVGDGVYEVVLGATVTAHLGEQVAFLIEVQQAGLFEVRNLDQEELGAVIGATCPGILYPYVRELISEMTTRGGFPPLLLAPADFDTIYQQRLANGATEQ